MIRQSLDLLLWLSVAAPVMYIQCFGGGQPPFDVNIRVLGILTVTALAAGCVLWRQLSAKRL
jgi:hypothetical protein